MDQILDTPVESQRKIEYAGFWIRAVAIVIDFVLLMALLFLMALISGDSLDVNDSALVVFLFYAIFILYFIIMESSDKQATVGKMAVGIKVGDKNGKRISFGRAAGRFFSKIVSGMILYIGYMMAGWDDRKQALHDKMADTYVFYSR